MQRELILCADDYAQSESVSAAILYLATQKRINAISCLVNGSYWQDAFGNLQALKSSHFIGLHLNLTFGQPLSSAWRMRYGDQFDSLSKLLWLTYSGQLDMTIVMAEIEAQLNLFIQDLHMYPDFIDGHQHIQQLPVVRDALIAVYNQQHEKVHGYATLSHFDVDTDPEPYPCFLRQTYNGWKDWCSIQGF
ncbi:MAG TPA: ChbG/HpnK family deacetylase, partial [Legionellaceae bacterium]|nr:ChbG/HpnK family deacetylase [Legionellaceae bacterium]